MRFIEIYIYHLCSKNANLHTLEKKVLKITTQISIVGIERSKNVDSFSL